MALCRCFCSCTLQPSPGDLAMRDERKEIVLHWFVDAQRYWILSRVAEHELNLDSCAWHTHSLALELIIKAAILTIEPRSGTWASFNSRAIFRRDQHDVVRLLRTWNKLAPPNHAINADVPCLHDIYSSEEKRFVAAPDSFGSLSSYQKKEMTGRYSEGVLIFDTIAVDAANTVFFRLRAYLRAFLDVEEDAIDHAIRGNVGRSRRAEWLSRAVRKNNVGLPMDLRVHD